MSSSLSLSLSFSRPHFHLSDSNYADPNPSNINEGISSPPTKWTEASEYSENGKRQDNIELSAISQEIYPQNPSDDSVLMLDSVNRHAIPYAKYFFAFGLLGFLALMSAIRGGSDGKSL